MSFLLGATPLPSDASYPVMTTINVRQDTMNINVKGLMILNIIEGGGGGPLLLFCESSLQNNNFQTSCLHLIPLYSHEAE